MVEWLRKRAHEQGTSLSAVMREAIERGLAALETEETR